MDQDLLVEGTQNLCIKLNQQYGPVHLLMLLDLDPDLQDDYWNLVVSAKGLDSASMGKAIDKIMDLLPGSVSKKVWRGIGRVTPLRTNDPFVAEMNRFFKAEDTPLYLQGIKISGVNISKGIVLRSWSVKPPDRRLHDRVLRMPSLTASYQSRTVPLYRMGASQLAIRTTYTQARANLAELCDEVTENQEVVIISRRGAEDVALVSASELSSLTETAHLLRSPKNAARLLKALERARSEPVAPQTVEELRREIGLDPEK